MLLGHRLFGLSKQHAAFLGVSTPSALFSEQLDHLARPWLAPTAVDTAFLLPVLLKVFALTDISRHSPFQNTHSKIL